LECDSATIYPHRTAHGDHLPAASPQLLVWRLCCNTGLRSVTENPHLVRGDAARDMIRSVFPALAAFVLSACASDENLRSRHGSPLHTYRCEGGSTFEARQILSGEIEVTAGGRTRDVADADGDPAPNGPRMTYTGDTSRLTGMPGGPYEACRLDDGGAE
jgi:hypothetical protein